MNNRNFMSLVNETLNPKSAVKLSRTENGALGFANTKSALLDMNFKISSYRNASDATIINDFTAAYKEDKNYALKFMFYVRDILEGVGERRLFRVMLKHAAEKGWLPYDLVNLIPAYGRYDDWFVLFDTSYEDVMLRRLRMQFLEDLDNFTHNKPYSLLAKWMPSINASSQDTVNKAYRVMRALGLTPRKYRKLLANLRSRLNIVEVKMTANKWGEIDYETVASKANLLYKEAFLNHDYIRRSAYLGKAVTGEAKMHAKTLAPYEIVHKYVPYRTSVTDPTLETLWKNLPVNFDTNQATLVVADGSGSMWARIGNTEVNAWDVATSLAIYFAEKNTNPYYRNRYITFSSKPEYVELTNDMTLKQKLNIARMHSDCSNTNVEAVFDLILDTARTNGLRQSDLPAQILIVSDMEFDNCIASYSSQYHRRSEYKTLFENIARKFARYGYRLPKLIFWNVNSRTNTVPVQVNELGVILVSGFSTNVFKMVTSNKTDPLEALLAILDGERYAKIKAE